jgi:hypothetical protein
MSTTADKAFYSAAELRTLARENYVGIYVGTLSALVFQGYVMSLVSPALDNLVILHRGSI